MPRPPFVRMGYRLFNDAVSAASDI